MRALLDVNVLIALLDASHQHHRPASAWFHQHAELGWATCPITQNGTVRILSHPGYPNAQPASSVAQRLQQATATEWHRFWPDSVDLLNGGSITWDRVLSGRHVTDLYLLALAVSNDGRLVTFDTRIQPAAIDAATGPHLLVLDV